MEKGDQNSIIRIAVVGPESTGKSELCEQLANHYQTVYVPEYAREYLKLLNRPYTFEDVCFIAEQQLLSEEKIGQQANKFLFCDTTLLTIKIWFQVVFKRVPDFVERKLIEVKYNHYLLLDIDMPWVDDPLREHPHFRKELLEMHIAELKRLNLKYSIVSGLDNIRTRNAITLLNDFDESTSINKP